MFSLARMAVCCVFALLGCTDADQPPPTRDASTMDASMDASRMDASNDDAGVSMDATVLDAVIVDATTDAVMRPDPALFDVDDVLSKAQCGVDLDLHNDGTIEQQWDYEFDANGRVARMVERESNWGTTVRLYDAASRLVATSLRGQYCSTYSYEAIAVPMDAGIDDPASCSRVAASRIMEDAYFEDLDLVLAKCARRSTRPGSTASRPFSQPVRERFRRVEIVQRLVAGVSAPVFRRSLELATCRLQQRFPLRARVPS